MPLQMMKTIMQHDQSYDVDRMGNSTIPCPVYIAPLGQISNAANLQQPHGVTQVI